MGAIEPGLLGAAAQFLFQLPDAGLGLGGIGLGGDAGLALGVALRLGGDAPLALGDAPLRLFVVGTEITPPRSGNWSSGAYLPWAYTGRVVCLVVIAGLII